MVNTTSVVCPPGFDCQAYSTCPSYILPCPDGFFCSSYEGSPYQSDLDFEYAYFANQFENDVTITNSNKEKYVVANRTIQNSCLQGFYCPNATTILVRTFNILQYWLSNHRFSLVQVVTGVHPTQSSPTNVMYFLSAANERNINLISSISSLCRS